MHRFLTFDPVITANSNATTPFAFRDATGALVAGDETSDGADLRDDLYTLGLLAEKIIQLLLTTLEGDDLRELIEARFGELPTIRRLVLAVMAEVPGRVSVQTSSGRALDDAEAMARLRESSDFELLEFWVAFVNPYSDEEQKKIWLAIAGQTYLCLGLFELDGALTAWRFDDGGLHHAIVATECWQRGNALLNSESARAQTLSEWGKRAAMLRLRSDPKQADKNFVRECWIDWQVRPHVYASKAAFARAMLEKCENITSAKVVEDWCRAWEKNGSQPVG